MTRVHIHARDIVPLDAVGNFTRQLAQIINKVGHNPVLWAENYCEDEFNKIQHRNGFWEEIKEDDVIFFSHSIFDPILSDVSKLPHRKILYFHNVTKPELIDPNDQETVENCRKGLAQIEIFSRFDAVIANSSATLGLVKSVLRDRIPAAAVAAPVIGLDRFGPTSSVQQLSQPALLCVGRLVPHKRLTEVVALFGALQYDFPNLELHIVGGPSSGNYIRDLRDQANAVSPLIRFFHDISDSELAQLYKGASACISLSAHEGFCVPALDALFFDKPFFCTPIPSVQEILGKAAILIPDEPQAGAREIARFLHAPHLNAAHAKLRAKRRAEWEELASGNAILKIIAGMQ